MNKLILSLICLLLAVPCQAKIIFVDADANGLNDGSSWTNAYKYLQDALVDANASPKPVEVRIAQGTYKPDRGAGIISGSRWLSFKLKNGVAIKGGYAGLGAPDPNTRNIAKYKTILSGDLKGNDDPNSTSKTDNSFHVVTGSGTDVTAVLDGFTVSGGSANGYSTNGYGGGIFNDGGNPTLINCTFITNFASEGGAVLNYHSAPTFISCIFMENSARNGSAMVNRESSPTVLNCTFIDNSAYYQGGAIFNQSSSNPILANCFFIINQAGNGGAISNDINCSPTLINCTFAANTARYCLPGMSCVDGKGGAIYSTSNSHPVITNCILWRDYPDELNGDTPVVTYSNIKGGWPGQGNINIDPLFDDFNPLYSSPYLCNCRIRPGSPCINAGNNSAVPPSALTDLDDYPRIVNDTVDMGCYEYQGVCFTFVGIKVALHIGK